ncbi:MAG: YgiT-type zinc finger protein [Methanophagales archaeon]|nr:YgiT-type zinc finger protein [Methanophagales archaeon]
MKTCYMCGGDVERRIVEVEGVIVKGVSVEVCTRCGEKYFNTKAATFVQKITRYVNDAKKGYLIEVFNP